MATFLWTSYLYFLPDIGIIFIDADIMHEHTVHLRWWCKTADPVG